MATKRPPSFVIKFFELLYLSFPTKQMTSLLVLITRSHRTMSLLSKEDYFIFGVVL